MQYTDSQQRAIATLAGNLQIIACAGSGKTQVISQRIVAILREKTADVIGPANIVAFTFTEKAAGELKDRIHRLCKEQLGHDTGLADLFVGTIHGFWLDLLQTYELRFLKYTVLGDVQQRLLVDRHSKESGLADLTTHDGKPLKRWTDSRLYQKLLSMVREAEIDEVELGDHPIRSDPHCAREVHGATSQEEVVGRVRRARDDTRGRLRCGARPNPTRTSDGSSRRADRGRTQRLSKTLK